MVLIPERHAENDNWWVVYFKSGPINSLMKFWIIHGTDTPTFIASRVICANYKLCTQKLNMPRISLHSKIFITIYWRYTIKNTYKSTDTLFCTRLHYFWILNYWNGLKSSIRLPSLLNKIYSPTFSEDCAKNRVYLSELGRFLWYHHYLRKAPKRSEHKGGPIKALLSKKISKGKIRCIFAFQHMITQVLIL